MKKFGKVKGRLSYEMSVEDYKKDKKKKQSPKEVAEALQEAYKKKYKKKKKKATKKSICNHIDAKSNKKRLKAFVRDGEVDNNWKVCKICKERIPAREFTKDEYEDARDIMLSIVSTKMMSYPLNDREYNKCAAVKEAIYEAYNMIDEITMIEDVRHVYKDSKKNKKKKGKKGKKKPNQRMRYKY